MTLIAGLDVGGAHLKVAVVEDGRAIRVQQLMCPLWRGIDRLDTALAEATRIVSGCDRVAVTMTGELSDLFESRRQGVGVLAERLTREFGENTRFWMGERAFGTCDCAIEHHRDVGSTNFLATAKAIAARLPDAILIDLGSTTADIVPVAGGRPGPLYLDDAGRQASGELVYTGFTRTAVMGVTQVAPFGGQWVTLAREYLATMADVRRVLGNLDDAVDLHDTADGRGKSLAESTQRLARMLGRDAGDGTAAQWRSAARHVEECQLRSIHDGLMLVLSRHPDLEAARVVTAGIGADAAAAVARRAGLSPIPFGELVEADKSCVLHATHCAPAVAVAMLAAGIAA
ncbi:MAG: hydantoinase/oxoprolinase family protein [Hyphomicrobiaceae bacterium]